MVYIKTCLTSPVDSNLYNMKQQRAAVHKDLQYERNRCTFDPVEVTYFLDGSPEKTKQRREQGIVGIPCTLR